MGFDCRTADFHVIRAKAVILCCGAAGRLGLPASGYLFGTYENPTNAGDGYAMAYHAGAELTGIECFQINPLIKDYNGPACAYVTGPFGGYTANANGQRFIECDYWSGQMMLEFYRELQGGKGPVFLKLDHLADETITEIETILHSNERPSRGRFHAGRGTDYRERMVEMHISEIGLCSGHSASGVWVNEHARDHGARPVRRRRHGQRAAQLHARRLHLRQARRREQRGASAPSTTSRRSTPTRSQPSARASLAPLLRERRPAAAPGRVQAAPHGQRLPAAAEGHAQDGARPGALRGDPRRPATSCSARDPHELMRALEVHAIRDCAEMAARASLFRTESRWGLYHPRVDYPRAQRRRLVLPRAAEEGRRRARWRSFKRPIEPYIVPLDDDERNAYQRLRIARARRGASPDHGDDRMNHRTHRHPPHASRARHRRRREVHRRTRAAPSASTSARSTCWPSTWSRARPT